MLKTISFFVRPYKGLFSLVVITTILASILESLHVMILLPLFNALLNPSGGNIFEGMPKAFSNLKKLLPFDDVILSVFTVFIVITVVKTVIGMLREWLKAYSSGNILYDLKRRLLEKYSSLSYQNIINQKQGGLIYKCTVSSKMVATYLLKLSDGFAEVLKILAVISVLASMQPKVTAMAIVIGLTFYSASHYFSRKISYQIGKKRVISGTGQNIIINELFNGIKSIITFNARERWLKEFDKHSSAFTRLFIKDNVWINAPRYVIELVSISFIFGAVIYLKILQPSQFNTYLPLIGVFAFSLLKLLPSITNMGRIRMELLSNLPELEVVYKALNEDLQARRKSGEKITTFNDSIQFNNVSFAYNGSVEILKDISISFEKGKVTAIVGASGSGKTSLINIILGLLEPTKGQIKIDNKDINSIALDDWNHLAGLVSQDNFIYHSTIRENITFGDTSYSEKDIIDAAKIAYAHDFISAMPDGYDTIVGERGMKLSGGQQQRLSIARAVLRKPEIFIFDEATSALDSISEQTIQKAIQDLSKGHTVIIIAHRLTTVKHADKIIVLDKGRVSESGVHDELIKINGTYSRLAQQGL